MERTKLKGIVILILLSLNVVLFGIVFLQHSRTAQYQEQGREQAIAYLAQNGIELDPDLVPWRSGLTVKTGDTTVQWEIQAGKTAETLLVDFVREMKALGQTPCKVNRITEEWWETKEEDRGVRIPVWVIETDVDTFTLNCASGIFVSQRGEESTPESEIARTPR